MVDRTRVLIAEDRPSDCELARRAILKAIPTCVIEQVETREDYIAALEHFGPDLIISDYGMPGFTGIQALKLAQERTPLTPVIIWTGSLNEDIAVECMKAGASNYVIKEHIKRLGPAVTHALAEKQVHQERSKAEQALRDSEAHYRHIVDNASDIICRLDPQGHLTFANPVAARLLGCRPEDLIGKLFLALIRPDFRAAALRFYARQRRDRIPETFFEFPVLAKDGREIWIEQSVNADIRNDKLNGYHAIARDITARKRAEQESRKRAEQMESLRQIGLDISARLDLRSVLEDIGKRSLGLLRGVTVSFYLYRQDLDVIVRDAFIGPFLVSSAPTRRRGEGLIGRVWESAQPMYVNDYGNWGDRTRAYDASPSRNVMAVPLRWREECLGVMTIVAEAENMFTDADLAFMDLLAMQASVAIRNAQLYQAAQEEIRERKAIAETLRQSEERYSLATQGSNDGLWDWNLRDNHFYFSPRWKEIVGAADLELGTSPEGWFNRIHPDDLPRVKAQIATHLDGNSEHFESEHRVANSGGTYGWVQCRGLAVRDQEGIPCRMAGSLSDITARKQAEEQLLHHALYDGLTGLPNRALLMDRLGHTLERAKRFQNDRFAVLFLDFDRFKVVNDSLGHEIGDELLVEGARRIASCVRSMDTVARLGGDEFVVLLEEVENAVQAETAADRILKELATPYHLGRHQISSSASIGIVLNSLEHEKAGDLLRDADIAMHSAKALGKARYCVFDSKMRDSAFTRLELERDLPGSLERGEITLHYQPILSLRDSRLVGFEALARWQHPRRGIVSPIEFIPIAEDTGLVIALDLWILRAACRQMHIWQSEWPVTSPLTISVNLSAKHFKHADLPDQIAQVLRDTGLDAHSLRLEITETVLVDDAETTAGVLEQLRSLGIGVQIDDFGTGYSTLSRLQTMPIDTLKIDRSFLNQRGAGDNGKGIIRTIVTLAHQFGLGVIAEGVESVEQWAQLRQLECEYGQGYLWGKPQDDHTTEALIAECFAVERGGRMGVQGAAVVCANENRALALSRPNGTTAPV